MLETQKCALKEGWETSHVPPKCFPLASVSLIGKLLKSNSCEKLKRWSKISGQEANIKYKLCSPGYWEADPSLHSLFFCLECTTGPKHIFKIIKLQRNTTHGCYTVHLDSRRSLFQQHNAYKLQKIITATATLGDYVKIPVKSRKPTEEEGLHQKLCSPCRKHLLLQVFSSQLSA